MHVGHVYNNYIAASAYIPTRDCVLVSIGSIRWIFALLISRILCMVLANKPETMLTYKEMVTLLFII